jgi:alpha-ribazole phosphatase/probable phosphoglycerate mutase
LLLFRHGETYESRLDAVMPAADADPQLPLTERGRDRLREVAAWIAKVPVEHAYASPYLRAQQTAQIIAQPHGLEVATLDALSELPLHPPPGGTLRDVAQRYIELVRDLAERAPDEVFVDDGRSLGAILTAAQQQIRATMEAAKGTVLIVAHGGLNRFLLGDWMGIPLARAISIEQSFACVNVVEFVGSGRPWVRTLNLTLHDPLKSESAGI